LALGAMRAGSDAAAAPLVRYRMRLEGALVRRQ
jgi:hypothetical protein